MNKDDIDNIQVNENDGNGNDKENKKSSSKMKSFKLSKKNKNENIDDKKSKKPNAKVIVAVVIALIAVCVVVFLFITKFSVTEGQKIFNKTPLGRNIEFIEKDTDSNFLSISKASSLSKICVFDYVCESEKMVSVDGINLPEWAVLLRKSSDNTIIKATYYNFKQVSHSFKGNKMQNDFSADSIKYGMKISEVNKTLGIAPYTIYKEIDNKLTYVYRFYYNDTATGDDVVVNCYVVFNELDETVKDVYTNKIDYVGTLLMVN